jgi:aminoglycoside phosphotransferase (APT) family kinase protein
VKSQDLERMLGVHAPAALRQLDAEVVSIHPVTTHPTQISPRATFRLELADGRTLKARRMKHAQKAARMTAILAEIDHPRFARVLCSRGELVIEAWIAGTPLSELPPSEERSARACEILGSLHALPSLGGKRLHGLRSTQPWLERLVQDVDALVGDRTLEPRTGRQALDFAIAQRPARAVCGLIHGDFSPENIVVEPSGELCVVDNETLRVDHLDYDLARTWLRWPSALSSRFLAGPASRWYASSSEASGFWRIVAILKSAAKHRAWGTSGAGAALSRLDEVFADRGSPRASPGSARLRPTGE